MAKGKLSIKTNICKGCGICIKVCPQNILAIDRDNVNVKGYNAIMCTNEDDCIACTNCATICPDVVFTVHRIS